MPRWVPDVVGAIKERGKRVPQDIDVVSRSQVGGDPNEIGCVLRPKTSNREVAPAGRTNAGAVATASAAREEHRSAGRILTK